jgi:hypothetical protein
MARIERTRQELGETVKSAGVKVGAWPTADSTRQLALPVIVTATAIVVTWLLLARRRRR